MSAMQLEKPFVGLSNVPVEFHAIANWITLIGRTLDDQECWMSRRRGIALCPVLLTRHNHNGPIGKPRSQTGVTHALEIVTASKSEEPDRRRPVGMAGESEFRGIHQSVRDGASGRLTGRRLENGARDKGHVCWFVSNVIFGVSPVLGGDGESVLIREEWRGNHKASSHPRVQQGRERLGSDVIAMREDDHGVTTDLRHGLGTVNWVWLSRHRQRWIPDFGDELTYIGQHGGGRRGIVQHVSCVIDEGAARHADAKGRRGRLLNGETVVSIRRRSREERCAHDDARYETTGAGPNGTAITFSDWSQRHPPAQTLVTEEEGSLVARGDGLQQSNKVIIDVSGFTRRSLGDRHILIFARMN